MGFKTGASSFVRILVLILAMIGLNFCAWSRSKGQRLGKEILTARDDSESRTNVEHNRRKGQQPNFHQVGNQVATVLARFSELIRQWHSCRTRKSHVCKISRESSYVQLANQQIPQNLRQAARLSREPKFPQR